MALFLPMHFLVISIFSSFCLGLKLMGVRSDLNERGIHLMRFSSLLICLCIGMLLYEKIDINVPFYLMWGALSVFVIGFLLFNSKDDEGWNWDDWDWDDDPKGPNGDDHEPWWWKKWEEDFRKYQEENKRKQEEKRKILVSYKYGREHWHTPS